jgi:hypothetical protein
LCGLSAVIKINNPHARTLLSGKISLLGSKKPVLATV